MLASVRACACECACVCVCVCDRSPIDFLSWSSKRFVFPHRRASMAAGGSGIGGDGDSGYAVGWLSSPLSRWSVLYSRVYSVKRDLQNQTSFSLSLRKQTTQKKKAIYWI